MTIPDLLLVNPGSRLDVYQSLASDLVAIEPPIWAGLLASAVRSRGYPVGILDAAAEDLAPEEVARQVAAAAPRLVAVIVYGHQPSASTQNMTAAGRTCRAIKDAAPQIPMVLIGGHPSALPERTLRDEAADLVCEGEGVHTLVALLEQLSRRGRVDPAAVPGVWYREGDGVRSTARAPLVTDLDRELPGVAWDLLPMHRYRAHNWHCFGRLEGRSPYAALYTTLGCPFRCSFCCINAPFGRPAYRMRSPAAVAAEIDLLVGRYGVRNIKIADEMFVLNTGHVRGICERLTAAGHDLNIWAYARIDTVKPELLDVMRRAGITWLALGIESGSEHVRDGADKSFGRHDIHQVVRSIQAAGISVIGNYIFGLPDDTLETMQQTLDLALELNCEMANFYCAMAYPGSALYALAEKEGWPLPDSWQGFSQHSVDTLPLPTRTLTASQVLRFRDDAFARYFSHPPYVQRVAERFGPETAEHVREIASRRLVRRHA